MVTDLTDLQLIFTDLSILTVNSVYINCIQTTSKIIIILRHLKNSFFILPIKACFWVSPVCVQQEILPHEFTGQKPDPPKHQNKFKEKHNYTKDLSLLSTNVWSDTKTLFSSSQLHGLTQIKPNQ